MKMTSPKIGGGAHLSPGCGRMMVVEWCPVLGFHVPMCHAIVDGNEDGKTHTTQKTNDGEQRRRCRLRPPTFQPIWNGVAPTETTSGLHRKAECAHGPTDLSEASNSGGVRRNYQACSSHLSTSPCLGDGNENLQFDLPPEDKSSWERRTTQTHPTTKHPHANKAPKTTNPRHKRTANQQPTTNRRSSIRATVNIWGT